MKIQMKTCNKCNQEKPIWKNHLGKKYCKYCWMSTLSLKKDVKQKRIKAFSDKKLKETKENKQKMPKEPNMKG